MMSQKRRLQFVFLDFYVAALCNLGFTICGSYIEQVWPPLLYTFPKDLQYGCEAEFFSMMTIKQKIGLD